MNRRANRPRSGSQYRLRTDHAEVQIAGVGASLRSYTHDGRSLVVPYGPDQVRPNHRGATLAPWPNRVVDGRYRFDDVDHQLALTEPARGHALHGLLAWQEFAPVAVGDDEVTLTAEVQPQAGYPWRLSVETTYRLGPGGLTQTVRATNLDDTRAPYGTAPHPYLTAGPGPVDGWRLLLPAGRVLLTDDRLVPTELVAVDRTDPHRFDFRSARAIGAVEIDHAFTDLRRDRDGCAEVRLTGPDGAGVAMTWDARCPWVQIHTADLPAGARDPGHRVGLAVEPMTCAPDAFNGSTQDGLRGPGLLPPGETATAAWRIAPIPP